MTRVHEHEKDGLKSIFRVVVMSQKPFANAQNHGTVAADDGGKGGFVARFEKGFQQLGIGVPAVSLSRIVSRTQSRAFRIAQLFSAQSVVLDRLGLPLDYLPAELDFVHVFSLSWLFWSIIVCGKVSAFCANIA